MSLFTNGLYILVLFLVSPMTTASGFTHPPVAFIPNNNHLPNTLNYRGEKLTLFDTMDCEALDVSLRTKCELVWESWKREIPKVDGLQFMVGFYATGMNSKLLTGGMMAGVNYNLERNDVNLFKEVEMGTIIPLNRFITTNGFKSTKAKFNPSVRLRSGPLALQKSLANDSAFLRASYDTPLWLYVPFFLRICMRVTLKHKADRS